MAFYAQKDVLILFFKYKIIPSIIARYIYLVVVDIILFWGELFKSDHL